MPPFASVAMAPAHGQFGLAPTYGAGKDIPQASHLTCIQVWLKPMASMLHLAFWSLPQCIPYDPPTATSNQHLLRQSGAG